MLAGIFVMTDSTEISGSKVNLQEILESPFFFRGDFRERNDKIVCYVLFV